MEVAQASLDLDNPAAMELPGLKGIKNRDRSVNNKKRPRYIAEALRQGRALRTIALPFCVVGVYEVARLGTDDVAAVAQAACVGRSGWLGRLECR